jgi:hypothetical protein
MNVVKLCAVVCLCVSALPGFGGVTVSSPHGGSLLGSPVHFVASGSSLACSKGISAMGIYTAPNVLAHITAGGRLDTKLNLKPGEYNVVVQRWDHCGSSSKQTLALFVAAASAVPRSNHVWIITEENHSYENVIGNSAMPYLNSLANKYALATQY